jgi:hypothetical protein
VLLLLVPLSLSVSAQKRNLLTGGSPEDVIKESLIPLKDWKLFPRAGDVSGRARLLEENLEYRYTRLPATCFLDFVRNGNRTRYQDA